MNDPLLQYRAPLTSFDAVKDRIASTNEIKHHLTKLQVGQCKTLYTLDLDGSYWVEEYPFSELQGGGPACLYLLDINNPIKTFDTEQNLTTRFRKQNENQEFWDLLGDEEGPERCVNTNCNNKRVKLSVNCKTHHYENIKKEICPFSE